MCEKNIQSLTLKCIMNKIAYPTDVHMRHLLFFDQTTTRNVYLVKFTLSLKNLNKILQISVRYQLLWDELVFSKYKLG